MPLLSGLRTLVVQGQSPSIRANARVFMCPCRPNHYPSAIPAARRQLLSKRFPPLPASRPSTVSLSQPPVPAAQIDDLPGHSSPVRRSPATFSPLSQRNSNPSEHQRLVTLNHRHASFMGPLPMVISRLTLESRWWALIMRYTRFALTTGCPFRSDSRRNSAHTRR